MAKSALRKPTFSVLSSFIDLQERFVDLARIEPDWDSYGAAPVDRHALALAQALILDVVAACGNRPLAEVLPFDVMPLPTGAVQVIWRGQAGELDLDIDAAARIGSLLTLESGSTRQWEEVDNAEAAEVLR